MWFEAHEDVKSAIEREKKIKEWRRDWKVNLVQTENPTWDDLYQSIL